MQAFDSRPTSWSHAHCDTAPSQSSLSFPHSSDAFSRDGLFHCVHHTECVRMEIRDSALMSAHNFLVAGGVPHARRILMHVFAASRYSEHASRAAIAKILQRVFLT